MLETAKIRFEGHSRKRINIWHKTDLTFGEDSTWSLFFGVRELWPEPIEEIEDEMFTEPAHWEVRRKTIVYIVRYADSTSDA